MYRVRTSWTSPHTSERTRFCAVIGRIAQINSHFCVYFCFVLKWIKLCILWIKDMGLSHPSMKYLMNKPYL